MEKETKTKQKENQREIENIRQKERQTENQTEKGRLKERARDIKRQREREIEKKKERESLCIHLEIPAAGIMCLLLGRAVSAACSSSPDVYGSPLLPALSIRHSLTVQV